MFEYLEKFKLLPKEIKDKVSSPVVVANIGILEKEYGVDLAAFIMKIMVKDISLENCYEYLMKEHKLSEIKSQKLVWVLKEKVFKDVKDYLGIKQVAPEIKKFSEFDPSFPKQQANNETADIKSNQYLFSFEDEEEIRGLASKISGYNNEDGSIALLNKADAIIKEVGINFGSQQLEQRFKDIIVTYIKGVRDKIDTRLKLGRSFESGGLNFDNDSIDKVFGVINNFQEKNSSPQDLSKPKIKKIDDQIQLEKIKFLSRDTDYDLKKSLLDKGADIQVVKPEEKTVKTVIEVKQESSKPFNNLDVSHELAPLTPKIISTTAKAVEVPVKKQSAESIKKTPEPVLASNQRVSAPQIINSKPTQISVFNEQARREEKPSIIKKEINAPSIPRLNIPTDQSGKKIIKDVKTVPRTMNPIDELRYMDIVTFRRMGGDAESITAKILNKVKFLEEERFSRRSEAIKAWRNSPVYRLYLNIGQESIGNNAPINDIIEKRKKSKEDYLSSEEFDAIMDLNKSLRF